MKTFNYFRILCVGLLACVLSGCPGYPEYEITDELFVNKSSLTMLIGEQIKVTASPADIPVTWTSDNEAVATVTQTGLITSHSEGIAEITVSQGTSWRPVYVTVATPTVDKITIVSLGGDSTIWITMETFSDRIDIVRVFWNNNSDSIDFEVNNMAVAMMKNVVYPGGDYVFNVVSIDRLGNRSRAREVTALILNKDIMSAFKTTNKLFAVWKNTINVDHCMISYIDLDGLPVSRKVYTDESFVVINDYLSDLEFNIAYLLSTDTLHVNFSPVIGGAGKLDKAGWTIEVSDEAGWDGGGKNTVIDDNHDAGGFWHSYYESPLPHWAVIDMQRQNTVIEIVTLRRNGDCKTLRYFVGDSPDPNGAWTKIAEGAYESNTSAHTLRLEVSTFVTGRYLKLVLPDSFRDNHIGVSEVDVYGLID
jgi:hypothetical protein